MKRNKAKVKRYIADRLAEEHLIKEDVKREVYERDKEIDEVFYGQYNRYPTKFSILEIMRLT